MLDIPDPQAPFGTGTTSIAGFLPVRLCWCPHSWLLGCEINNVIHTQTDPSSYLLQIFCILLTICKIRVKSFHPLLNVFFGLYANLSFKRHILIFMKVEFSSHSYLLLCIFEQIFVHFSCIRVEGQFSETALEELFVHRVIWIIRRMQQVYLKHLFYVLQSCVCVCVCVFIIIQK